LFRFLVQNQNRTGPVKIYGFDNRFFISVRFFRLIFLRFYRFSRLIGYFEHPYLTQRVVRAAGEGWGCLFAGVHLVLKGWLGRKWSAQVLVGLQAMGSRHLALALPSQGQPFRLETCTCPHYLMLDFYQINGLVRFKLMTTWSSRFWYHVKKLSQSNNLNY